MTAKFWDKKAGKYDDLIRKHEGDYRQTIARAKSLLSASDAVLDLGCASGEYSLDIAPFVRCVHGIDTSAGMIALAARKASARSMANLTFAPADVFDRSLDAHHWTAVLAFNVLHLVEDLPAVLGRIHGLLPAGGQLIAEIPCFGERGLLFRLFIGLAQKMNAVPPILSFTVPGLEAAIAGAGFDITESREWDPKNAIHWIVARKRDSRPSKRR